MTPIYPHIIPKVEDWPINRFARERKEFVDQLNNFVFDRITKGASQGLEDILAKTIYLRASASKPTLGRLTQQMMQSFGVPWPTTLPRRLRATTKRNNSKICCGASYTATTKRLWATSTLYLSFCPQVLTAFFQRIFNRFKAPGNVGFGVPKRPAQ